MKDWKQVAEGLGADIPEVQWPAILPTLDGLEKLYRPLESQLRPEDDTATPFAPEIEA